MSNVTFIAGIPGSGKTALLIDTLLRDVIPAGRPVFIDERTNPTTGEFGPSIPELNIPHQIIGDLRKWHEPGMLPDGACLVVDEAQDIWPVAPSGAKLGADLLAMNRIRQRGITLYFTSQRPNMMHAHVRGLVGKYILLRETFVGRRYYEWSEFPENPLKFKDAPQQKAYVLPKRVFGLYRSATIHVKHRRTIPRAVWLVGACALALPVLGWYAYKSIAGKASKPQEAATKSAPVNPSGMVRTAPTGPAGVVLGRSTVLGVSAPVKDREPYSGLGLHMAGTWEQDGKTQTTFTVSIDGRAVRTMREVELQKAGYGWRILGPCTGVLIFGERERVVTCDSPQAQPARTPAPLASASAPA